ncbi:hypothetical protein ACFW91_25135 [Streptomyces asoensis]|uniref:hypothetical protein n=1 Tax=Streptomyces asoensis TaxID=249586 RepID=UPI00367D7B53
MSETTNPLLNAVTHMESTAFRAGQVARRVLTEHPHLTMRNASAGLYAFAYQDGELDTQAELTVRVDGTDQVAAWAQALASEPEAKTQETDGHAYETSVCMATVDGVAVQVSGARRLTDEEAAAWRTRQAAAAEGGEG